MSQLDDSYINKTLIFLKQTIISPSSQDVFEEFLTLSQDPLFLYSLFFVLINQSIDMNIRAQSCILIRKIISTLCNTEDLFNFIENLNFHDNITYIFEMEPCVLVRQVASLLSLLKFKFNIDVFPNLSNYLNTIIDIVNISENAFIFACEYIDEAKNTGKCISFDEKFAKNICNFVGVKENRIGVKALKIINYLTFLFMDYYREMLVPNLLKFFDNFDEEEQRYVVLIAGNFLNNMSYAKDSELIDFVISCISNQYESVGIAAAEIFEYCQMIPFQEKALFQLFIYSGFDFDLIQYNLSNQCLYTIAKILELYHDNVLEYLTPKIHDSLLSNDENLIRCGLRCYAIVNTKFDNLDDVFNFIVPLLNSSLVCDASYCLSSIAKMYLQYRYQVINLLFNSLKNEIFTSEIRCFIEQNISLLLVGVKLPTEPYLNIIIELLNKIEEIEVNSLLYLLGEFLGVIDLKDEEHLKMIFQIGLNLFKSNDSAFIASFHIFGNLLSKSKDLFIQILNVVLNKSIECLESNDIILISWILYFYRQAMSLSKNYEISIENILDKVITKVIQLVQPDNNSEVKRVGWDLIDSLRYNYINLFLKYSEDFLNTIFLIDPSNETIEVIGTISSLLSFYIEVIGKEFVSAKGHDIISILTIGLRYSVEDTNIYKKEVAKCAAKFYMFQNQMPNEIYQELMQIFTSMDDDEKKDYSKYLSALYEKFYK